MFHLLGVSFLFVLVKAHICMRVNAVEKRNLFFVIKEKKKKKEKKKGWLELRRGYSL